MLVVLMERLAPKAAVFFLALLLSACSTPARYVVISEDSEAPRLMTTDQRLVCLAPAEARTHRDLLALVTRADVDHYQGKRADKHDPVEEVLFHLVREDYPKASELLHRYEGSIPEYLRLLLNADFTYEESRSAAQSNLLIKEYQEAFEAQPCAASRDIIHLRIRQVRYLR